MIHIYTGIFSQGNLKKELQVFCSVYLVYNLFYTQALSFDKNFLSQIYFLDVSKNDKYNTGCFFLKIKKKSLTFLAIEYNLQYFPR